MGQRVVMQTEKGSVSGIVGAEPPYEKTKAEKNKAIEMEDLQIDIGVTENFNPTKELKIRLGDPMVPCLGHSFTLHSRLRFQGPLR